MPNHVIHELFRERWSPLAFLPERLPRAELLSLVEAARWSPSCFNAQPWRFVVTERDTPAFEAVLAGLAEGNRRWAQHAGALIVGVAQDRFSRNDKPNRWAAYDTGAATHALVLQAAAMGLVAHQMGGFDAETVGAAVHVPAGHTLMAVTAVGKLAPVATLPEDLEARQLSTRVRERSIAYFGRWGEAPPEDEELTGLLDFWFGELDAAGMADPSWAQRWWKVDPAFDEELRARFGDLYERALRDELPWASGARGRLGLIVLYDQLSRNLFRDTAGMYSQDDRAIALVLDGVEQGLDAELPAAHRVFFYMPLMHSEVLEHQQRCVALFEALASQAPEGAREALERNVVFAQKHLDIVERWGRFPHRNVRLGRPSTEAELAFLEQPGSSF